MSQTPDRRPGPSDEEGIYFEVGPAPTTPGEVRWNGTSFQLRDAFGTFDPRNGGTGLTHKQVLARASLRI